VLVAGLLSCAWAGSANAAAALTSPSPLTPPDHVHRVCGVPAPGRAHCLALELVPASAPARAYGQVGPGQVGAARTPRVEPARTRLTKASECAPCLRPQDLQSAYFPGEAPDAPAAVTQTIALVDAYDDPEAEADLKTYDEEFGLPQCTEANGCFAKVNQEGHSSPLPPSGTPEANEWAGETATDIEIAHAICQNCRILLVEAVSDAFVELEKAEETAAGLGATEISNSWGSPEAINIDSLAFNHPGVVITAAAGDEGYLDWGAEIPPERTDYPASSPHVIAVGGTHLTLNSAGAWQSETVWNDASEGAGGGGCSAYFTAPPWQQSVSDWSAVGCEEFRRASVDVAADADPRTGVAVYDSIPYERRSGWMQIGGTSVASPIIAAMFALAGGSHGVEYPARTLYENLTAAPGSLHDVVTGSNGECNHRFGGCTPQEEAAASCPGTLICQAAPGYDGPTGVGTPNGLAAFVPPAKPHGTPGGPGGGNPEGSGGSGGNGTGGGTTGGGPTGRAASPGTTSSSITGTNRRPRVVLSALTITRRAIVALDTARPQIARVAFAFTLNAAARVRATLARWTHVKGHWRWKTLPVARTLAAKRGHNSAHLTSHGTLAPGRYRLTLTPAGGRARSIVFQIG
jgi:hypothetical protein